MTDHPTTDEELLSALDRADKEEVKYGTVPHLYGIAATRLRELMAEIAAHEAIRDLCMEALPEGHAWGDVPGFIGELMRGGERLRKKCVNQRTELRRLNKYLGPYWAGFRKGLDEESAVRIRGIMNAAFGHEKVSAAEHAAIERRKV